MIREEEVYRIGKIGKPHGVKGEVTMMFSDDVFDRVDAEYVVIDTEGILVPFFFEEYRFRTDETAIVKFADIDTQEQARSLTNCEVFFPRHLSDGSEDGFSLNELVGFEIKEHIYNKVIGTVCGIDGTTANTLFEVRKDDGGNLLIPASPELITEIDTDSRTITMTLPEGLLDLQH
ncbi:MAG: ribosome maturation factor RimM [Prevotella sp.]|uniref:ribosome maturation factor RimM n=1 Tax=Prevotella sp. TaxID=59823 RepID=UPI002A2C5EF6|nr:ribosome maturation factor RimM [Prevotella sp.]MDD7317761.1 ribosome maturation factor RimM [Prevotellaceae bacterium]MDY4020676.1 ribosome maturation factor RimM [Prevotella sp.]